MQNEIKEKDEVLESEVEAKDVELDDEVVDDDERTFDEEVEVGPEATEEVEVESEEDIEEQPEKDLPEVVKDEDSLENPEMPTEEETETEAPVFTQSQVNALVGKARQEGRESALKELLSHYGVNERVEMDDIFGKGQAYESLNDEFAAQTAFQKTVMAENALLRSQIDANRWDDVKLILQGKGLDVTTENIEAMIPSHPEWRSSLQGEATPQIEEKPVATLRKLGNDASAQPDKSSEEEKARKLFGFN